MFCHLRVLELDVERHETVCSWSEMSKNADIILYLWISIRIVEDIFEFCT